MIAVRTIYVSLIVFGWFHYSASSQVENFLKAINDFHQDLVDVNINRSKRSSSIDELLSRFDDDDFDQSNLEPGDAWYQSFRAMECLHGGCSKRPLRWKSKKSQPEEDYEYYDDDEISSYLQDQQDHTKNDLSHEANYKLSKVEQDAVEQSLPKTAWPVRHPSKRRVDPMQAVKLKTSLRMIRNGDGPTLPSSFLEENRQKISIEDILENSNSDGSSDPWKENYESRRLLSVSETKSEKTLNRKDCNSGDCINHFLNMDQFDNLNQQTDLDRKLAGLSFDNTETNHLNKKGTLSYLSDELMHSSAFQKLQNFIKGKGDTGLNKTKSETKTTTTSRPTAPVPLNLVDKDRDVNINLHMSVNATVLGDGKLPTKFHKNNSMNFKASTPNNESAFKEYEDDMNLDFDRSRRGIVFPVLTSSNKRKANAEISKSVVEASDSFPLDEIITGKLTSQVIQTIFSLVKTSTNLKVLWPGLKGNKVSSAKQIQNFYAIRNQDNESEMHRTELMLQQAMETINAIIEQQVRSRSCVPLRSDLKSFYNLILATQAENDQLQDRQKRETTPVEPQSMNASQVRKKSRIVKKLLKDYEELPPEDQDQLVGIKESLLNAAAELRELEQTAKRRKRQLLANHLFNQNISSFQPSDLETQFTPQYLKLARTAEKLLHNSLQDPDLTIDFNSL